MSSACASISSDLRSGCGCDATRCDGEQAVGEARGDGARLGRSRRRRVLRVLRDQLHERADLAELDDLRQSGRIGHHPAEQAVLADAAVQVRREEERLVELVGADLDPDAVVARPDAEQPVVLLRVLDHVGERAFALRGLRRGLGGGGRRDGGRRRRSARTRRIPRRPRQADSPAPPVPWWRRAPPLRRSRRTRRRRLARASTSGGREAQPPRNKGRKRDENRRPNEGRMHLHQDLLGQLPTRYVGQTLTGDRLRLHGSDCAPK